jgi:hypothetical protein
VLPPPFGRLGAAQWKRREVRSPLEPFGWTLVHRVADSSSLERRHRRCSP